MLFFFIFGDVLVVVRVALSFLNSVHGPVVVDVLLVALLGLALRRIDNLLLLLEGIFPESLLPEVGVVQRDLVLLLRGNGVATRVDGVAGVTLKYIDAASRTLDATNVADERLSRAPPDVSEASTTALDRVARMSSSDWSRKACVITTRSESTQNKKRDHPRPRPTETTRVDGVRDTATRLRVVVLVVVELFIHGVRFEADGAGALFE